jgi:hypothetical protein
MWRGGGATEVAAARRCGDRESPLDAVSSVGANRRASGLPAPRRRRLAVMYWPNAAGAGPINPFRKPGILSSLGPQPRQSPAEIG